MGKAKILRTYRPSFRVTAGAANLRKENNMAKRKKSGSTTPTFRHTVQKGKKSKGSKK
jgi:hypothetical protein